MNVETITKLLIVAALTLGVSLSALAERTKSHFSLACGLTGTATSVVVDVYDTTSPGTILATIANSEVTRLGTTTCYVVDLSTTVAAISFPAAGDPTEKHYALIFRDDVVNKVKAKETVIGIAGAHAVDGSCERKVPVYATAPIPARGITQSVINAGKVSYMKVEVDCTQVFSGGSIVKTYYQVFFYDSVGRVLDLKPQNTVPSP